MHITRIYLLGAIHINYQFKYFWSYVHIHVEHDRATFNAFRVDDRNLSVQYIDV